MPLILSGDAFNNADRNDILQQQQQFAQKQADQELVDKNVQNTLKTLADTVKSATDAGKDPALIAKAVQPLIDSAASLALRSPDGQGQQYAARVKAMAQTILARVPSADQESYTSHIATDPTTLKQTVVRVGKNSGSVKAFDTLGNPIPTTPAAPAAPANPSAPNVNLTGPGKSITGIDVQPLNDGGPIVPGNIQVAQADTGSAAPQVTNTPVLPEDKLPMPEGSGGIDGATIKQRATMLANGDDKGAYAGLPAYRAGAAAKMAIANYATKISAARGQSPSDLSQNIADVAANKKSLVELTSMKNAVEAFSNTAIRNGQILIQLGEKVDSTGVPIFEKWIRGGKQATGSPDVAEFNAQMVLFRTEAARILNNPRLVGQLTDAAKQELESAIRPDASFTQVKRVVDRLSSDFANRHQALDDQIAKVKDKLGFKQPSTPVAAPAAQPQSTGPSHLIVTPGGAKFWVGGQPQ